MRYLGAKIFDSNKTINVHSSHTTRYTRNNEIVEQNKHKIVFYWKINDFCVENYDFIKQNSNLDRLIERKKGDYNIGDLKG